MWEGIQVVAALKAAGVTHVVWIPDSDLGRWESALAGPEGLPLIRVCREGEAFAVAAGLHLAGQKPLILLQCTGLFEAGDALRNFLIDLKLPLAFVVGVRSFFLHQQGKTLDTCPLFTEPILQAWKIPYEMIDREKGPPELTRLLLNARASGSPYALLYPE